MKVLFLHGWQSVPGGVKPTFLARHGHEVVNPKLPDEDFAEAIRIAQAEFDQHRPQVVVGSSRGGAVAMNINSGEARLVLLCPAWRKYGSARTAKHGTVILHSRADDVVPFADSEELVKNSGLPASALIEVGDDHRLADPEPLRKMLYELARSFVKEAPDREPVKFGIAILGLFQQPADEELFQALGRHDEFTLFCAVAITNASEDHDEALWTLARNVTGWGRIHVVERLARTTDPAIKRWLLREGFRNSIMYEYLAATCARAGGLLAALSEDRVDRELLTAAGEIIQALIVGGPAEGIDDYEDARPVIESHLGHMASSTETIEDFLHVNSIKGYLDEDDSRWASRYNAGWTGECREALRSECAAILGRPEWVDRVREQLGSEDELRFAHADQAAKALGIDTWDIHWRRLQQKPAEPGRWYHVMAGCDGNRIGKVIEFAGANIDRTMIATGAGDELGLGRGFEQHSCMDYVLQELRRFPRNGAILIEAGLKSPVVRNRNMAVNALAAWSREEWPSGLKAALERAVGCEPKEDVRERMQKTLRGEPLAE